MELNADIATEPTVVDDVLPPQLSFRNVINSLADVIQSKGDVCGSTLHIEKQFNLQQIKKEIGARQGTHSSLEFCPSWIVDQATEIELLTNWNGAYITSSESSIPQGANLISSHIVYKIKKMRTAH